MGEAVVRACGTGWSELDRELAGGGWPARSLTEILSPQPSLLEFRLAGGALRHATAAGREVVLVGAPKRPHAPGLLRDCLAADQVIWIEADQPAQRLWVVEQLVKSSAAGAILAWLPQARAEQLGRVQLRQAQHLFALLRTSARERRDPQVREGGHGAVGGAGGRACCSP